MKGNTNHTKAVPKNNFGRGPLMLGVSARGFRHIGPALASPKSHTCPTRLGMAQTNRHLAIGV
jgi:hypothetical protein